MVSRRHRPLDDADAALSEGTQGVWTWDVQRDRVYGDAVIAALFCVTTDESERGMPVSAYLNAIHPVDRERVRAAIDVAISGGAVYREVFRVTGEGWTKLVLASGRCYFDEKGSPIFYPGVVTDLSQVRSLTGEALGRIEQLLVRMHEVGTREVIEYMIDLALEEVRTLAHRIDHGADGR